MYNSFTFYMPAKVLFGAGQLQNLHLEQMPGRKALIVTSNGQSTKKYGYLAATELYWPHNRHKPCLATDSWSFLGGNIRKVYSLTVSLVVRFL